MSRNHSINLKLLVQNLRDLDTVSKKIYSEMNNKNKILQMSINNNKFYKTFVKRE
jgi:hypothetical protein